MTNEKKFNINTNWTSVSTLHKRKHYRIAGKRDESHYEQIEMMAVLDKSERFWISKEELSDPSHWKEGWL